jgi:methionyl aminopeptidase
MAQMRKSGLLVWAAHQVAKAIVRPGVTTAEIDAGIDEYILRHEAIPLFKGVPGKVPFPAATCISVMKKSFTEFLDDGGSRKETSSASTPAPG